jgi:hypothetical protein
MNGEGQVEWTQGEVLAYRIQGIPNPGPLLTENAERVNLSGIKTDATPTALVVSDLLPKNDIFRTSKRIESRDESGDDGT